MKNRFAWMGLMAFNQILRSAEDEGGGGAGYSLMGDGDTDPAPADHTPTPQPAPQPDRSAMLEGRLGRLENMISGLASNLEQNQHRSQSQQVEGQIRAAEAKATQDVDNAEKALAAAYEEGDGATIAKAQRKLSEAAATRERVSMAAQQARANMQAAERRDGGQRTESATQQQPSEVEKDQTNLNNWKTANQSWYGINADMTKAAHDIDAQIRAAGVLEVGSKQYFDALDMQMKQRYPQQFQGSPATGGTSHAPGQGAPRQQPAARIPQSVAEGYRRMGIDVSNPEVAARMVKNRQIAVDKGLLPEQPVKGRIFTR